VTHLGPSKGLQRAQAGAAIKRAINAATKKQQPDRKRCPVHKLFGCSPLLNGCSWNSEKGEFETR
jgi:hypothetical protein